MESHGLPGEIQVTRRVAAALGPQFAVRPRGTIDVKGKGPMVTFLIGANGSAPASPNRSSRTKDPGPALAYEEHAGRGGPEGAETP
jgi:hypothetical protein